MREYVILFAGEMGAGKTTAIASLSEIPVVATEAVNTDTASHSKAMTTVAMDYGEISLEEGDRMRLYGLPGQERFAFMWRILAQRALGLVILVDNSSKDPAGSFERYLEAFPDLCARGCAVIGITRSQENPEPSAEVYYERMQARGLFLPVLELDVRDPEQTRVLLSMLVANIEAAGVEPGGL